MLNLIVEVITYLGYSGLSGEYTREIVRSNDAQEHRSSRTCMYISHIKLSLAPLCCGFPLQNPRNVIHLLVAAEIPTLCQQ